MTIRQNLIVTYADQYGGKQNHYAVVDTVAKHIIFQSESKSEVIARAQYLKGWAVNGSEATYGQQITEHGGER